MSKNTAIPTLSRPIFDVLSTDEEKFKVAMAEYEEMKEADADGLTFANKTAMWIAYERQVESERDDRLFHDPLAQYMSEPYGKRLSDTMSFGLSFSVFNPKGADVGLGLEGHVMYTSARTKLINDQMTSWLTSTTSNNNDCQVVNVGCGVDTRVYWVKELQHAKCYWELDTVSVMKFKQERLDGLGSKLPATMCERKAITMDFSQESMADLPKKYGLEASIPTCWILEGIIMYLKREEVEQLLDHISHLSSCQSFIILNFSTNVPNGPTIDEIDSQLEANGWGKQSRLMFGENEFHFNRYPVGQPPNKILGMSMYHKR